MHATVTIETRRERGPHSDYLFRSEKPTHDYTFTWDPKWDWSHLFGPGDEIQQYFEGFAERHGSRKYMELDTKVVESRWDEEQGVWNITLEDQKTNGRYNDWAHVLINGTGISNNWKWPRPASRPLQLLHHSGSRCNMEQWDAATINRDDD
ncbi:CDP-diacylglycerol-glycerol-3-phosphate 3-phosphatidyltransferase [Venturia nashicola]|uniref:CDP-diacylglycerol--glycerol-3-phosphate 3-phosphatidyltransferase n=1 Tax=Venturia nashicola TaxID=86259 RepID=A0A4Z1P6R0_9PEZI|nr:CDP-diacylglycerol--glycerol-3-phosphate 3-phosphatidyltransferase [Venturia nashicola]TLD23635.1 CDP-diacylglycerol-glycerol-3-phosphate 3-phosphatidyltransferase [Venturia nashicola]